jgi:general secretion pathway protein J
VLVAIAIFALVSAMAYGSLNQVLHTRDRLEDERAFWQALTLAFLRIEEDVSQARSRPVRDVDGGQRPPFVGRPTDNRSLGAVSLELTHGGVPVVGEGVRSDLQRVAYRLHEGVLQRLVWPPLDRAPQSKPIETPMLAGVEDFRLRYYHPQGAWTDTWPPLTPLPGAGGAIPELPRGVEVRLTLADRGEFTRLVLIHE